MADFEAAKTQSKLWETALQTLVFSLLLIFASLVEQAIIPYTAFRAGAPAQVEVPLICLTFGLRVLGAYLTGFRSIVFFAPAAIALDVTSQTVLGLHFENGMMMLLLLAAAPAIFMLLDWASPAPHIELLNTPMGWRVLASGSILIAMVETLAIHALAGTGMPDATHSQGFVIFFGSKLLGLAVVLAVLMAIKRVLRPSRRAS